jgi:hypothetical protein
MSQNKKQNRILGCASEQFDINQRSELGSAELLWGIFYATHTPYFPFDFDSLHFLLHFFVASVVKR